MRKKSEAVLFLCYGNPARLDDALGAVFGAELERRLPAEVDIEVDYQLNVEHALDVAGHQCVVFVDAAVDGAAPFTFQKVVPRFETTFTTHSVGPENLMGLACSLFHARTSAYLLAIRGYDFEDFGEVLSREAKRNLDAALQFAVERLQKRDFEEAARSGGISPARCC